MKVSLKLLEDQHPKTPKTQNTQNPIHFSAKIPIAVFGLPFLSAFTTTHNHPSSTTTTTNNDLSLSLRTHFSSGPSLKLSYNATSAATSPPPLTLTLKSGISFSGSPINSPLTISANFSFSPSSPNPSPTFLIHFKPKMGSFSLRKAISSVSGNEGEKVSENSVENGENSYGFVPLDRTMSWKGMAVDSVGKDSILSGVLVSADTELPVTKRVKVNLRWGVGIPSDFDRQLPYLRVNKIKIERVDEVKEDADRKLASELGEFDMLKGMYSWMSKELSDLQCENREMRRALEDVKSRQLVRSQSNGYSVGGGGGGGKRAGPVVEATTEGFEQWRAKKKAGGGGEANGHREVKKNAGSSDVESELQRAIKAASSP